jgi:Kef-type K+ transport system membrane component KefB
MNIYYEAAIWIGMALLAAVVSIRIAVPVALVEIVVGAAAGNLPGVKEHVTETDIITFLAGAGSIMLTFLAGAEIDPVSLKRHWKASVTIGVISFTLPFLAAFAFCYYVLGWHLHAAEIGGIALSTTSVAVVYAIGYSWTDYEASRSPFSPPSSSFTPGRSSPLRLSSQARASSWFCCW